MAKTKILFITHEMSPFLELSNIADITRNLPQAMQEKGMEIRILMPRFGNINERRNRLHEVIRLSGLNIIINDNDNPLIIKVASIPTARMQVYFLDNEEYFQRKYVFNDSHNKFYEDNDERIIFFCKGALETVKKLGWSPDIVHCHGWMSALVPMFMKTIYSEDPTFKNSKIVYSAYESGFEETLNPAFTKKIKMQGIEELDYGYFSDGTFDSLQLGAMEHSDALVFGSENLSEKVNIHLNSSGKPTLNFDSSGDHDRFQQFYEELVNEELISLVV
jgi:starch synthase